MVKHVTIGLDDELKAKLESHVASRSTTIQDFVEGLIKKALDNEVQVSRGVAG